MGTESVGDLDTVRDKVAASCRILAMHGLVREITGHVSARIPGTDHMFIRCRLDDERGLPFTTSHAIKRVDFDGNADHVGGYSVPIELPIHGELFRRRPEVNCVIHAHPPAALLCGILDLPLRPIFGSYDPDAMLLAHNGIPLYPRSVLIRNSHLGAELATAMQGHAVCLMRGHGITVVGSSIEEATMRALRLEMLAEVTVEAAKAGRTPPCIGDDDVDDFLAATSHQRAAALNTRGLSWHWNYHLGLLAAEDARLGVHATPVPAAPPA